MQRIKLIDILLLLCIITSIILVSVSISKYKNVMSVSDSVQVAVPIINLEENVLDVRINPTDTEKDYVFKVSNKEEDKKSEVSMQYTLEIKNTNNLPLKFELYNYANGAIVGENLLSNNKTQIIPLKLNDEEQEYQLKIKWNQENKNYQYAKVIDYGDCLFSFLLSFFFRHNLCF